MTWKHNANTVRVWAKKLVVLVLIVQFSLINTVFAQPDLKLPWDSSGPRVPLSSGPHGGTSGVTCLKLAVSQLTALDFAIARRDVLAASSGTVVTVGSDSFSGNYVRIDHGGGWQTGYYHLESASVSVGVWIPQGAKIGVSGNTGIGAGGRYHLHFELKPQADGVLIDGYRVHAVKVSNDRNLGYNYMGTLTKGNEQERVVSGQCYSGGVKVVGSTTVDAENNGLLDSTNQKVTNSCTGWAVGAGSSRQQTFVNAYNRNGGQAVLGCPYNAAYWWQGGGGWLVRQDFARPDSTHFTILHDEGSDNPPGTVPAYVLPGWARDFYLNYGGSPSLGVPVSDEFTNSFGHSQQNFSNGFIWRDAARSQTNTFFSNNAWHWLDKGGDYSLNASFASEAGGGVRLILDGQGGASSWVRSAWVGKDIPDVSVTSDLRVVWEQYDRAHMLFFGLVIRGTDGVDRLLFYSHDGDYWALKQFARNVFEDFRATYGVDPVSIKELRVGHYLYDPWVGDVGGTVRNIIFDYAPPQTSLTINPAEPDGQGGWHITSPQITLIATDDASGVEQIEYNLGSGWQVYGGLLRIEQGGEIALQYRAVDKAGRIEEVKSQIFKIDITSPQTEISNSSPYYEDEEGRTYVSAQTEFMLLAEDETSGVAKAVYADSPGPQSDLNTYTEPFTLEGEDGQHTISYNSNDYAGNVEAAKSQEVYLDSTAPVSSDDYGGEWRNTDVTVTLTAQDPTAPDGTLGSGVQKINYDGSQEGEVFGGQAQVSFTEEGIHDLTYFAVDNVENVEEEKQAEPIKIDKTPPEISGAPTEKPNKNNWYNEDVTVHFTATDQEHLSGVKEVTPGVTVLAEGADQEVTGVAVDNAGNIASTVVSGINIDKTDPFSKLDPLNEYYNNNPLEDNPIELTYTSSDNLSGVDRVRLYESYQGGDWEYHNGSSRDPGSPFNVRTLEEGSWEFASSAKDKAGNCENQENCEGPLEVEEADTSTIYDITDPRTIMDKPANENGWYNLDIEVVLGATDEHPIYPEIETSGVSQTAVIISKDGELFANDIYQKWDIALPFEEDGIYVVEFYSEDRAGNVEEPGGTTVKLDKTKPTSEVTSLEQGAFYNAQTWPGLAGLASDNLSGVSQVEVRIDKYGGEGNWEVASGEEEWVFEELGFEDGFYTVYSRATDRAGNRYGISVYYNKVSFVYDATPPVTQLHLSSVTGLEGWYVSPVVLELDAEDATSGVSGTFYRILGSLGSDPEAYRGTIALSDGIYEVEFWSVDRSGNEEEHQIVLLKIDTVAPAVPTSSVADGNFFEGERVFVSLLAADGDQIYYSVDGRDFAVYTRDLIIVGTTSLSAYAVDEAGNKSAVVSWSFIFVPKPPAASSASFLAPPFLAEEVYASEKNLEDPADREQESGEVRGIETVTPEEAESNHNFLFVLLAVGGMFVGLSSLKRLLARRKGFLR